jgi:hypothetical protein
MRSILVPVLVAWVLVSPLLAILVGKATAMGQRLDAGRWATSPAASPSSSATEPRDKLSA